MVVYESKILLRTQSPRVILETQGQPSEGTQAQTTNTRKISI